MILDNDPVYQETAQLVIALAIVLSRRLLYGGVTLASAYYSKDKYPDRDKNRFVSKLKPERIEAWRLHKVGFLTFEGIAIDKEAVQEYAEYYELHSITENSLPNSFAKLLEKARPWFDGIPPAHKFLSQIASLVKLILLLSHVSDLERCLTLPLLFDSNLKDNLDLEIERAFKSTEHTLYLKPYEIFSQVMNLISTNPSCALTQPKLREGLASIPFLCSDFGWSVLLDVAGEKDPAAVNWMNVHVREGVPTRKKTNERRSVIDDGSMNAPSQGESYPQKPSAQYLPRAIATSSKRKESWSLNQFAFSVSLLHELSPSPEFEDRLKKNSLNIWMGHGDMMLSLYMVSKTPTCEHAKATNKSYPLSKNEMVKLGPDATVVLGCAVPSDGDKGVKVMVLLTRGVPCLRWYAIVCAGKLGTMRDIMPVTPDCCETCALEYTASLPGKWALIL